MTARLTIATLLLILAGAAAGETERKAAAPAPTADEQIAMFEKQCAASADARAARHAAEPLFERLGGEEGIHALTKEIVRLHLQNDGVARFFDGLDTDAVADHVAKFVIAGTGGPDVYGGPDLTTSHAHLNLTNADFVSAGGDIVHAMQNLGYGPDEIDEFVCILVGLRSQVVLPSRSGEAAVAD